MFSNKNKNGDFKRLFKDLPDSEQLIVGEFHSQVLYCIKNLSLVVF